MAHSLSAKKRIRQNEARRLRNQVRKSMLKSQTRKFTDALTAKDVSTAEAQLTLLAKRLDQVASKGTIHRNHASRRKSRLQRRLNALKAAAQS